MVAILSTQLRLLVQSAELFLWVCCSYLLGIDDGKVRQPCHTAVTQLVQLLLGFVLSFLPMQSPLHSSPKESGGMILYDTGKSGR